MHQGGDGFLRKSQFVTRGPSELAKQPNNRKAVAHTINIRGNHTSRPCQLFLQDMELLHGVGMRYRDLFWNV
jgi:hypothetical protein